MKLLNGDVERCGTRGGKAAEGFITQAEDFEFNSLWEYATIIYTFHILMNGLMSLFNLFSPLKTNLVLRVLII